MRFDVGWLHQQPRGRPGIGSQRDTGHRVTLVMCPSGLSMTTLSAVLGATPRSLSDPGLAPAEASLLSALFDADGATEVALVGRVGTGHRAVLETLDTLTRRGLVEQAASRVWLTAGGFALRRASGPGWAASAGPWS